MPLSVEAMQKLQHMSGLRQMGRFSGLGQSAAQQSSQQTNQATTVNVYAGGGNISDSANVGSSVGKVIQAAQLNYVPIMLGLAGAAALWLLTGRRQ